MSDQAKTPDPWSPPEADQEFVFESVDAAPTWVDKNWASYDVGPALAVPAGDLLGGPPYTTSIARVGDTVMFKAATPYKSAHILVVPGEPTPESSTLKVPQVSAASLEDMLKSGVMTPDDLGPDARAQVLGRSPSLKMLIEEGKGAPEKVPVEELVRIA